MTFEELINKLQKTYTKQTDWHDEELYNILKEIKATEIASKIETHEYRWYEKSITVYKVKCEEGEKLLGISHVSKLYNENSSISDLYCSYDFFEMEETKTITYKKKRIFDE